MSAEVKIRPDSVRFKVSFHLAQPVLVTKGRGEGGITNIFADHIEMVDFNNGKARIEVTGTLRGYDKKLTRSRSTLHFNVRGMNYPPAPDWITALVKEAMNGWYQNAQS